MLEECNTFKRRSAQWAQGQLKPSQREYIKLLTDVYENASVQVVSTSTIDFLPVWGEGFGEGILEAHKKSKAKVKRIFVFDELAAVTEASIEEMKKQYLAEIDVRVYSVKEDYALVFPDGFDKNFAFVDDGDVIVVTNPASGSIFSGTFYFKEKGFIDSYKSVVKDLEIKSKAFEVFMKKHDSTWAPPNKPVSTAPKA